jgi:hypothetical protein
MTCGRHKNHEIGIVNYLCGFEKADGTRCHKLHAEGDTVCKYHRGVINRREEKRREEMLWDETMQVLWGQGVVTEFAHVRIIIEAAVDSGWITQRTGETLIENLNREWRWYRLERLVANTPAKTELQALAMDGQNVHTKEVNQQTSDAKDYLLKTSVPTNQDTLREIEIAWIGKDSKKVLKDIRQFSKLEDNDFLYKRMLDGLWARIQSHPEKGELIQRLWEETNEAVTKCYQGHISRLGNVLVGFTEEVKAEVSVGEILQQKMGAIAAKDIGVEYKVCEAWSVFEELKVPMAERDAWIEAF